MWPDNETDTDFLNFAGVSDTIAAPRGVRRALFPSIRPYCLVQLIHKHHGS
jgi:hypothetical protein